MNMKLQKCFFCCLNRWTFWPLRQRCSNNSRAEPLVVSSAFLATQPCNLVVLGVIIPSLFIVIVSLALRLACPLADILKSNSSAWKGLGWCYHWHWFLSAALHFFPPLSDSLVLSWIVQCREFLYGNLKQQSIFYCKWSSFNRLTWFMQNISCEQIRKEELRLSPYSSNNR